MLKNTYPENTDIANARPIPNTYIMYSESIFFIFLIPKYTPYTKIAKNGPKYSINPSIPKLNKKAGISISNTNSLYWFIYPFPNIINNGLA